MSLLNIGDWFSTANTSGYQTQSEADKNLAAQQAKLRKQQEDAFADEDYGYFASPNKMAINANALAQRTDSVAGAASSGFVEGLKDGIGNVKAAVTGWGPFKLIPVWLWVVGILWVVYYFGGFAWLKRKLK